ncbi:MAG: hypothetical protein WBF93_02015 [Pirellulales bacterium]
MYFSLPRPIVALGVALLINTGVTGAEPVVDLDLIMPGRVPVTAPQEWNARLAEAGFRRVNIRKPRVDDEIQISSKGSPANPVYHVVGYLMEDGSIMLPPRRKFGPHEAAQLARWVRDLKKEGLDSQATKSAFGLSPKRLEQVNEDLKRAVRKSTVGVDTKVLVARLAGQLEHPLKLDNSARRGLEEAGSIRDEFKGLSIGTALAATLRPAGLVLRPHFTDGELGYLVMDSRQAGDNWPIGWAPKEKPSRLIPNLMKKEQTQEVEVSLAGALAELSDRVGVPFLWDHNGLAQQRVKPDEAIVTMHDGKSHSASILRQLLGQVRLTYEVRTDDNQKPFLWITTVQRR